MIWRFDAKKLVFLAAVLAGTMVLLWLAQPKENIVVAATIDCKSYFSSQASPGTNRVGECLLKINYLERPAGQSGVANSGLDRCGWEIWSGAYNGSGNCGPDPNCRPSPTQNCPAGNVENLTLKLGLALENDCRHSGQAACKVWAWAEDKAGNLKNDVFFNLDTQLNRPPVCNTLSINAGGPTCEESRCSTWTNGACGAGSCASYQRQQTRTCDFGSTCLTTRCVSDYGCGPAPTGESKLGIQTSFQNSDAMRFISEARPRVVKLLDGFGKASDIKNVSPQTFVVGRIVSDNQPLDDPVTRARQWFNFNKNTILAAPDVDCWEGYNETGGWPLEEAINYGQFEAERVRWLASIGRKACIGNFGSGGPPVPKQTLDDGTPIGRQIWNALKPAFEAAKANGGYFGLHEYSAPGLKCLFGDIHPQWDGKSDEGWLAGRYRKVYRDFLIPNNLNIPLIITEAGIDAGGGIAQRCGTRVCNANDHQNDCGWRKYTDANTYLNELIWYDSLLKQDSYVLGATIFQMGISGWSSFEVAPELTQGLIDYVKGPAASQNQNRFLTMLEKIFSWNYQVLAAPLFSGLSPLTISLQAQVSDPDPGDTISQYEFDFGDNTAKQLTASSSVSHTYINNTGQDKTFTASARAKDAAGDWSNACSASLVVKADRDFPVVGKLYITPTPAQQTYPLRIQTTKDYTLKADVADNSRIAKCDLFLNGILEQAMVVPANCQNCTTTLKVNFQDQAVYPNSYAWCQDASGNGAKGVSVEVRAESLWTKVYALPSPGVVNQKITLRGEVFGTMPGTINYKFDCREDGFDDWDLQINNVLPTTYEAKDLCQYSRPGNYRPRLIVERGTGSAGDTVDALTIAANQPPQARFVCDASACGPGSSSANCLGYQGCLLKAKNLSSDPNGNQDLKEVSWTIKDKLTGLVKDALNCPASNLQCDYTLPATLLAKTYNLELKVKDASNEIDTFSRDAALRKDIGTDFVCSTNNQTWRACDAAAFKPAKGAKIYFHDSLSDGVLAASGLVGKKTVLSDAAIRIIERVWLKDNVPFSSCHNSAGCPNVNPWVAADAVEIVLRVKDDVGRTAQAKYKLQGGLPVPEWQEIAPTE